MAETSVPLRSFVLVTFGVFLSACGVARTEDLDPLVERMAALEQRLDALEAREPPRDAELERQLAELRRIVDAQGVALAALQSRSASGGDPPVPTTTRRMDPDLERRLDEAGVKIVEGMLGSKTMEENLEVLGQLSKEYLEQELERAKEAP
jgi:hypothetical protein